MSNFELSLLFFLQITTILGVCHIVGLLAKKIGQPQVVAEMIAGVLIGPSLFGLFLPDIQQQLFPPASKGVLFVISQLGLVLYMFLIGLEFDQKLIQRRIRSVAAVSLSGILVPFVLGCLLVFFLMYNPTFFNSNVTLWEAMFFTGAAMSITAFPMLARIIYENRLAGTSLGTLALAAGSMDDAAAWCVLAIVLASFSNDPMIAIFAIGGGILYTAVALTIGKRLLQLLGDQVEKSKTVTSAQLTIVLGLVMMGAWLTDIIGIYAVFGAFIMGAAMPRGIFASEVRRMLEPVTTNLLLPLFFIYSGLNTRIGLVDTPYLWVITICVLLAACFGKGIACWAAARFSGESNRDALAIGTLMNARGLMELIILNIGLERNIITPVLFTVMVLMAIVTTLMASPLFEVVYRRRSPPFTPVDSSSLTTG